MQYKEKKVLLVDDMRGVRMLVERFLLRIGFEKNHILSAENGKIAFDLIQKEKFDLVISDLNMDEMNGIELVRSCRQFHGNDELTFFILSSEVDPERTSELMSLGVKKYLTKPFNESELLNAIQSYL